MRLGDVVEVEAKAGFEMFAAGPPLCIASMGGGEAAKAVILAVPNWSSSKI